MRNRKVRSLLQEGVVPKAGSGITHHHPVALVTLTRTTTPITAGPCYLAQWQSHCGRSAPTEGPTTA